MQENNNIRHYILLHFLVVLFGLSGVAGKYVSFDAEYILWWRVLLGVVPLIAIALWLPKYKGQLRFNPKAFVMGLVLSLHWFTFFYSIKISTVAVGLVTLAVSPFFNTMINSLCYTKRIAYSEMLFAAAGVVALSFMLSGDLDYIEGYVWGLVSALASAIFSLQNERMVRQYSPINITINELNSSLLVSSVYIVVFSEPRVLFQGTVNDYLGVLFLGTVLVSFAYLTMTKLMKSISSYTILLAINLEPVYGILVALVVFGESEHMSNEFYIGSGILISILILEAIWKKQVKKRGLQNTH